MAYSAGAIYVDVKGNTNPLERQLGGLGSVASKVGKMVGAALAGAATINFGRQCVQLASDLNEVQNVVDVTFKTMSARMDEWAQGAAGAFGLSETMAKRYAGTFGSMAEAFGFTEKQAYDMSTALTGLAGDVASFYNIEQDAAYAKLKSVFSGETESLKELGVVMTQSALDQYALANGYGKTTKAMSEQEKVSLRLAFVQHALANASGDFQRTSGSWANQVRLLTLNFQQLQATIGQSLIAALLPVVKVINVVIAGITAVARAFNRLIEAITGRSMGELTGGTEQVSADLSSAAGAAGGLADGYGDAADAAGGAAKAQKELNKALAGFDEINKLSSSSDASGSGGGSAGGAGGAGGIGSAIAGEADTAQKALDKLKLPANLLSALERVKKAFSDVAETIRGGWGWAYENVLVPFGEFFANTVIPDTLNLVADALEHVNDFLKDIGDPLGRFLTMAEKFAEFAWSEVLQPLLDFGTNEVLPRVLDALGTAFDVVVTCAEKISPVLKDLWDYAIKPIGQFLGDTLLWALDRVNDALDWLLDCCQQADFSGFIDWMHQMNDWLGEKLAGAAEVATDAVKALRKVWNGIKSKTATLTAKAREGVSGALDTLRKQWDGIKDKTAELTAKVKTTASAVRTWWTNRTSQWKNKTAELKLAVVTLLDTVKKWWANLTEPWKSKDASLTASSGTSSSSVSSWWSNVTAPWKNKGVSLTASKGTSRATVSSWWSNVTGAWKNKRSTLSLQSGTSYSTVYSWWSSATSAWQDKTATMTLHTKMSGVKDAQLYLDATNSKYEWQAHYFAQGGFVQRNSPMLAVIGDNRREGEIVSPESKFQTMLDKAASGTDATALLPVLNEILDVVKGMDTATYLDGDAITRRVVSNVNAQTRSTGRCAILV